MRVQLSDHFTYRRLFRFVLPSVAMMIFTSIYSVVDGVFVSNFVGKIAFAAVNFIMPVLMMCGALGFMMGAGGSALVSMLLGEGKRERANCVFSLLVYVTVCAGIVLTSLGFCFMPKIVRLLGADGLLAEHAVLYGRIVISVGTVFMVQNVFQSFLIVAEKPTMGLVLTVSAGLTNIVLDAVFVGWLGFGLRGAAFATFIAQCVGGIIPLVYFLLPNKTNLRLGKTHFDVCALAKAVANGSSELVTNIAMSFVSMLYNAQLIRIAGESGIAAYGALMYVSFIFAASFVGYGSGTAPVVSYHYGAQNLAELKNLFKKDVTVVAVSGIAFALLSYLLAAPLARLFGGYDEELFALIRRACTLYSLTYLFCGFNIVGSSFFTALNNGFASALISFARTFVFQTASVLTLPLFFALDGIWLSAATSELLSFTVVVVCVVVCRRRYGYA